MYSAYGPHHSTAQLFKAREYNMSIRDILACVLPDKENLDKAKSITEFKLETPAALIFWLS